MTHDPMRAALEKARGDMFGLLGADADHEAGAVNGLFQFQPHASAIRSSLRLSSTRLASLTRRIASGDWIEDCRPPL